MYPWRYLQGAKGIRTYRRRETLDGLSQVRKVAIDATFVKLLDVGKHLGVLLQLPTLVIAHHRQLSKLVGYGTFGTTRRRVL